MNRTDTTKYLQAAFEKWWYDEGSGLPPRKGEDAETHVKRIAEIAWHNGAHKQRFQPSRIIK
jgi:hypothetical protein